MRDTLTRVEHTSRWAFAVATGLGAVVLWSALVRADEPPLRHGPAGSASAGSASTAAAGPATPVANAAPSAWHPPSQAELDALARVALKSAAQAQGDGDYHECLWVLASGPNTWWHASDLSEEVADAVWLVQRDCTRRLRAEADKAVRAKDYATAIELLEPVADAIREGSFRTVTVDGGWLLSDLAFAYQRNHQYVECIHLIGSLSLEGDQGTDRLLKAIGYNLDGCNKKLDAEYAIKSAHCRIPIEGAIATAAAPRAMAPEGATAACVALIPGKRPPDASKDEYVLVCPVVALVWKGAKGAVERKELPTRSDPAESAPFPDPLDEEDFCTGLTSIAVGAMDDKRFVRVSGAPDEHCQGRQCLHIGSVDMFYEWNGKLLVPALDLTL